MSPRSPAQVDTQNHDLTYYFIMGNQQKPLLQFQIHRIKVADHLQLPVRTLTCFPHQLDGLRLWDSGIVAARYVLAKKQLFKGKKVLELGTGVGLTSICAAKFCEAKVTATDYKEQVLQNCRRNAQLNKVKIQVKKLDWTSPGILEKYQIILASDVIYHGCPVEALFRVFESASETSGLICLLLPARRDYEKLCQKQLQKYQVCRQNLRQFVYGSAHGKGDLYPLLEEKVIQFEMLMLKKNDKSGAQILENVHY